MRKRSGRRGKNVKKGSWKCRIKECENGKGKEREIDESTVKGKRIKEMKGTKE